MKDDAQTMSSNASRIPRTAGLLFAGFALFLTTVSLAGAAQEPQKPETKTPEDVKAEEAFTRTCIKCHPVDRIAGSRRTRSQWEEVMTTMQTARGAVIADEDWDVIQAYLVKHYGRVNVNRATVNDLVEVLGVTPDTAKAVVEYRKGHGDFIDYDAFAKVPGLDLEKLDKLRDAISF
jgi:competence ComEA-like helix-hairpin-helix protein